MDLVCYNSLEFLNFYFFDFGINGFLFLRCLLYVVDFFIIDDDEKIVKFIVCIKVEMFDCKKVFSCYNVVIVKFYC